MKKITKKLLVIGFLPIIAFVSLIIAVNITAQTSRDSVNGQGTVRFLDENGKMASGEFTFDAQQQPNGTIKGKAVLHNPSFKNGNGQNDKLQIDITCLKIDGNVAFLGGTAKRKNSLSAEAVFFSVQDNGQSGSEGSKVSQLFYWDDDPKTAGDPQTCKNAAVNDFPLEPIVSGSVQVRRGTAAFQQN